MLFPYIFRSMTKHNSAKKYITLVHLMAFFKQWQLLHERGVYHIALIEITVIFLLATYHLRSNMLSTYTFRSMSKHNSAKNMLLVGN